MTKVFVEEALQHLTDATVSDALLRNLLDPIMDKRLTLAYAKLQELMAVHREYPETRNPHFVERYNALQRNQWTVKTTKLLQKAFEGNDDSMNARDIPQLLTILRQDIGTDADLVAAESTFNAMQAFYQVLQIHIQQMKRNNIQIRLL